MPYQWHIMDLPFIFKVHCGISKLSVSRLFPDCTPLVCCSPKFDVETLDRVLFIDAIAKVDSKDL